LEVRTQVAHALGQLGGTRALDALIHALQHDERWEVRKEIAERLGEIGDRRATSSLIHALLRDDHGYVNIVAARALGKLRDPSAIDALHHAIRTNSLAQSSAINALAQIPDPRVIPALLDAVASQLIYTDEDESVAMNALRKHTLAHPDAILKLPIEDRNRLGRILQDKYREQVSKELCK